MTNNEKCYHKSIAIGIGNTLLPNIVIGIDDSSHELLLTTLGDPGFWHVPSISNFATCGTEVDENFESICAVRWLALWCIASLSPQKNT